MNNYYNDIKNILIDNKIYNKTKEVSKNRNDILSYFEVGRILVKAQGGKNRAKYGDKIIKEYSEKLTKELGLGYSTRSLKDMRKFYLRFQKGPPVGAQLTWSHYRILLSLKDENEMNYYINLTIKNSLSKRKLQEKIKSKEYQRLEKKNKNKLLSVEKEEVIDYVKNPIIIKNNNILKEKVNEKVLKSLILENIKDFLKELGFGFSYISDEYKIKIGNRNNYIDLLLYNIKFNCYVVIELKTVDLKKEHIGQIMTYMNYIDKNLKTINQDKTIGIIICKKDNKLILEYCSDSRIYSTTYVIN